MSILQYLPSLDHKIETKIYFFKTNCKRNSDNFSFHKKAINVEVLLSVNISGVKFTRGGTVLSRKLPPPRPVSLYHKSSSLFAKMSHRGPAANLSQGTFEWQGGILDRCNVTIFGEISPLLQQLKIALGNF